VPLEEKLQDFQWFAERFFHIRDRHGHLIPFKLNALQTELYSRMTGQDDILKARQGGCSTLIVLKMLHRCMTRSQQRAIILAHETRSARQLMTIAETALDHLPDQLRPKLGIDTRSEKKIAGLDSALVCATARNPDIGRGGTINMLHASEIAMWENPQATLTAIGPSLGPQSIIARESTAKGAGNYWHQQWVKGKNNQTGYRTHFFPWWVEPSYAVELPDPGLDPDDFDADGRRIEFVLSEREQQLELSEAQARWRRRQVRKYGSDFAQEYAEDDTTCFLTTGRSIFDNRFIQHLYELLIAGGEPALERDEALGLSIYHKFTKQQRAWAEFVIGADSAEGIADPADFGRDGDFSAASVLEKRTGIQVASVWGNWEPYEFAHVLSGVAQRFSGVNGYPLMAVERNGHGAAVLSELYRHLNYPALYSHEAFDRRRQTRERRLGWHTNSASRPIMINDLVHAVNKSYIHIRDPELLAECLTFVKNRKGRAEAQLGCHDDRVMAAAIAWQMRMQSTGAPLIGTNFS
jgi:hypothetical protein